MTVAARGFVTLVGAGPGDPGLLTLAGKQALETAEVVLHDRLVGEAILALIPESALAVDVGKNMGLHPVPQAEINRLLLEHALEGRKVVRLKGGDPFLFGRGAEELDLLIENGIPFRVVPGVTSAIAVPAYAGIPVTHRDFSSSVHIVTGHGKNDSAPAIAYRELAATGGTLVFLMGLSALAEIRENLLAAGLPPDTPAALVENGARPDQRRLLTTLDALAREAGENRFRPPALLVVGKVCGLAENYDWTSRLPLWGKRILAVSSKTTASRLASLLREYGAGVDEMACVEQHPLPQPPAFWHRVGGYQWLVLTSRFGIELFFGELRRHRIDLRGLAGARFAVVGNGTAAALAAQGIIADYVPEEYNSSRLGAGLIKRIGPGEKILLYRARAASDELEAILRKAGVSFDGVDAYETRSATVNAERFLHLLGEGKYDALTFTSASAARYFADWARGLAIDGPRVFCIGQATASAAGAAGMRAETGPEATLDGMARFIVGHL